MDALMPANPLPIVNGGTGANSLATAQTALGTTLNTASTLVLRDAAGNLANIVNSGLHTQVREALILANGLNSNLALPSKSRVSVTGPTGAFSIGGFATSPADGTRLTIINITGQPMTIVHNDGGSISSFRTATGGNVACTIHATLEFLSTLTAWLLFDSQ